MLASPRVLHPSTPLVPCRRHPGLYVVLPAINTPIACHTTNHPLPWLLSARSLFEKDKILFGFTLAFKLKLDAGLISSQELRFLMTGQQAALNAPSQQARAAG